MERPNRFTAEVEIQGKKEIVHVKIQEGVRNCLFLGRLFMYRGATIPNGRQSGI